MQIPVVTGIDSKTLMPLIVKMHPFLAGVRRRGNVRIPGSFTTKRGQELPCNIVITKEALKKPAKQFGAKEQARAERRLNREG